MVDLLKGSAGFAENILNHVDGMFYRCSYRKDWTVSYISDGCKKLTGYEKEELLYSKGLHYNELVHPDDVKWLVDKCFWAFKNKAACNNEFRIITRKGTVRHVKNVAIGVYDDDGKLLYVEGFIQDNTLAKKERQFLKELNAYKHAINENIMVLETDTNGQISYANNLFCDTFQYDVKKLVGKNIEELETGINHALNNYYAVKRNIPYETYRSVAAVADTNGEIHYLDQVIAPVFEDHKVEKYLFLCLEITEKVSADQLKNDYIKMLEDMLFMVSHKVRQPVSHILGIALLIDEQLISAEELTKVSRYIKDAATLLDSVTKEMSGFISQHRQKHYS